MQLQQWLLRLCCLKNLKKILKSFESGDIPQAIAYSVFPNFSIPSSKWSFLNRLLMSLAGTDDARGYNQWKTVNRYVNKGAKAFYILVPRITKHENDEGEGYYDIDLMTMVLTDTTYEPPNELPDKPNKPTGPTSGRAGPAYTYCANGGDAITAKTRYGCLP